MRQRCGSCPFELDGLLIRTNTPFALVCVPAVQEDWDATISRDRPQLKESGIEHLAIEFV